MLLPKVPTELTGVDQFWRTLLVNRPTELTGVDQSVFPAAADPEIFDENCATLESDVDQFCSRL